MTNSPPPSGQQPDKPRPIDWNGHAPSEAIEPLLAGGEAGPGTLRVAAQDLLNSLTVLHRQAELMMEAIEKHCADRAGRVPA